MGDININYKDLDIKKVVNKKTFIWNEKEIEVLDSISSEDKYDIIMITLQKSAEDGYYNPIKLDIYFHLNLVYMFTNIIFDDENREDEFKLYDEMINSGFMEEFLMHIDIKEYTEMQEHIEKIASLKTNYDRSTASIIKKFVDDLPANAEVAKQIIDNFDPDQYQAVVDFAKAANGGRPV